MEGIGNLDMFKERCLYLILNDVILVEFFWYCCFEIVCVDLKYWLSVSVYLVLINESDNEFSWVWVKC